MVANSIPQGQVKAGDKVVNDVKLTNIPAGRFDGQLRPYSQADVEKLRYSLRPTPARSFCVAWFLLLVELASYVLELCPCCRGSIKIEHTLAQNGSRKLWELMHNEPYVHSLGALTGMQAMQMVKGGLKAIYCSGWQVAADANAAAQVLDTISCLSKVHNQKVCGLIKLLLVRANCLAVLACACTNSFHGACW